MAVTDDPSNPSPKQSSSHPLPPLLLPCIDLSTFSQSELHSLCLLSNSAASPHHHHRHAAAVVIAESNPPSFNESAAGRKQTYSPLEHHGTFSSSSPADRSGGGGGGGIRRRLRFSAHVSPKKSPAGASAADFDDDRCRTVVGFLKQCMQGENPVVFPDGPANKVPEPSRAAAEAEPRESKGRRRSTRKRKVRSSGGGEEEVAEEEFGTVELVNREGAVVDLLALKSVGDPYGEELRRRTEGLEREEELLGFLKGLDGKWCSRRKKRRIVQASLLSDVLPVGWKVIIALRRKGGRYSPFCRRLISPTGEHLLSCKEASFYLRSYFGLNDAKLMNELCQKEHGVDSETNMTTMQQQMSINSGECSTSPKPSNAIVVSSFHFNGHEDSNPVLGIDDLPDVLVSDIYECEKCKVSFSEKDAYVRHVLAFHEKTTRRIRVGSSVGQGVIIRDGKFECQFCHKVFLEKKQYSGHVGVHVRNFKRGSEKIPGPIALKCIECPSLEKVQPGQSKTNALIAIAQNSVKGFPVSGPEPEPCDDSLGNEQHVQLGSSFQIETEFTSEEEGEEEDDPTQSLSPIPEQNEDAKVDNDQMDIHKDSQQSMHKQDNSPHDKTSGRRDKAGKAEDFDLLDKGEEYGVSYVSTSCAAPPLPPNNSETFGTMSHQVGSNSNVIKVEDFVLDDIQPEKFNATASPKSPSLFLPDPELVELSGFTLEPSLPGREASTVPNVVLGNEHMATLCVWCGAEFYPEITHSDTESDSVGLLCPVCQTKISRHFNALE